MNHTSFYTYILWCLSLLSLIIGSSCEDTDVCDQPMSRRLKVVFKDENNNSLTLDTLYVYRDGSDKPEEIKKADSLDIVPNVDKNTTRLKLIRGENGPSKDLIITTEDMKRQYVSIACGFRVSYKKICVKVEPNQEKEPKCQRGDTDESQPLWEIYWDEKDNASTN